MEMTSGLCVLNLLVLVWGFKYTMFATITRRSGVVLIVEDTSCLQAEVYLQRQLFVCYEYNADGRPRFGVSLGLFVDCFNSFSAPGRSSTIEIQYPGPVQLLGKTTIPDTISWDYNFEPVGRKPVTFTVKIDFTYYVNIDSRRENQHQLLSCNLACINTSFFEQQLRIYPAVLFELIEYRERRNVESSAVGFSSKSSCFTSSY